jgi:tetratricopeptide (TPR) repeat protein
MKFNTLRYAALFILIVCVPIGGVYAQLWQQGINEGNATSFAMINRGIELYGNGQWGNAIIQLRRAQQGNIGPVARAEAQFWIAMAAFAAGDYEEALHDFDEINRIDPVNVRCAEVPYHKGRAYYYLKRYEDAIRLFSSYIDSIRVDGRYANGIRTGGWNESGLYSDTEGDYNRKSSAIYWMGECFYSMDDMTRSEELFNIVIKEYPKSYKFEPATNRLALIRQKKIEGALLDILRTVPSVSTIEEDTATTPESKKTTEEAILEYQRRIAPYLINDARKEQPQTPPEPVLPENPPAVVAQQNTAKKDTIMRLLSVKTTALEIMDRLMSVLNTYDIIEDSRW